jgi:hypothetical protein
MCGRKSRCFGWWRLELLKLAPLAFLVCPPTALGQTHGQASARPVLELRQGEKFFRLDGTPAFVLGRNPVGRNPQAYAERFQSAAAAGERLMRIHFTYSPPGEKAGQIDAGMLKAWDAVLDSAAKQQLAVLPALGVWADWNDGSRNETWHTWDKNPFNAARGGPAKRPSELFEEGACQKLWLQRLETFVKHWSHRRAIVGWEIFSELDLVTGASESRAVAFAQRAAAVIRAADPLKRPLTASQAGINEWPLLLRSPALDFIQVHPYAGGHFGGRLDELILSTVRQRLATYGKPVLLGECGLDSAPPRGTLDAAPRAEIGIRHAIWAAVVSGAMNGRMLWWQDGYDQFERADLARHYGRAAATAVAFVRGVDFTGFAPLECEATAGLKGAMVGNDRVRLGWFRDASCIPPNWPVRQVTKQRVTFASKSGSWHVEFFSPATGKTLSTTRLATQDGKLTIDLPAFEDSIAYRAQLVE